MGSSHLLTRWIPRLLVLVLAFFLLLNAFESANTDEGSLKYASSLLFHLIPTILVVAALLFSWNHEKVGGFLFISLSLFFLLVSRVEADLLMTLPGPLLLIGILFLLDSYLEKRASH